MDREYTEEPATHPADLGTSGAMRLGSAILGLLLLQGYSSQPTTTQTSQEDRSSSEPGGPGLWLSTVTLGTQLLRLLIVACKGPGGARRSLGSAGGCRACGRRDRQTGPHTGDSRAREQEQVSLGPSGCQPLQTSSLGPFLWELRTAQRPEPAKE
ncbi:endothelial cell-specific chemotaxis regulator isoform X1 [Mus musculus]|uniref:endothelial cell-specific chemotaxis regulator isoform X1 n=1 Tax=Mus musculus TaxID=10090 RepID=UPI0011AEB271|nr:endothelial cell-specific chemotaxis regulator isoform X1 [Mus musculus]